MGHLHVEAMENGAKEATLSPSTASRIPRLQLPSSCDPPGPQNPPKQRAWVVFGATGHIGNSIVKAALAHNDVVTAVGQTFKDDLAGMQNRQFDHSPSAVSRYLNLVCDVRVRETVDAVLQRSIAHWGRIDVIVNCSGSGVIGACEDQDESEIRNQFEVNFGGTLNIIQLSLPYFRQQGGGRYLIFSSTSGALGVPGLGPFCATKYAVEGLIESMLYEVDAFNIKATLVEPGPARRSLPNPASHMPGLSSGHFDTKPASEPYAGPTAPAGHAQRMIRWLSNKQPTSVVKAAELVWQLGHCGFPPLRFLLGSYAVESVKDRLRSIIEEIEDWKYLSFPVAGEGGGGGGGGVGRGGEGEGGGGRGDGDEGGADGNAGAVVAGKVDIDVEGDKADDGKPDEEEPENSGAKPDEGQQQQQHYGNADEDKEEPACTETGIDP